MSGSATAHSDERAKLDTSMHDTYIFHDHETGLYSLRGQVFPPREKRTKAVGDKVANTYAFECDNMYDILNFLKEIYNDYHCLQVSFLNYDNLPLFAVDVTYARLQEGNSRDREISGFDYVNHTDKTFDLNRLPQLLSILRNMYQEYQPSAGERSNLWSGWGSGSGSKKRPKSKPGIAV